MGDVVGREALAQLPLYDRIAEFTHRGEGSADQVVDQGDTLRRHAKRHRREQQVVVDQGGAMAHLHKKVLALHAAGQSLGKRRLLVVVQKILRDPGALGLPVCPDPHRTIVDAVAADGHVDGRVQLDARDLSPAELHHIVDVVYMVVFDGGKGAAHPPDDPALLTVMDLVAADDVASHFFFDPSMVLSAAYGIPLHLGRALDMLAGKVVVVVRVQVLPEADAGALAVGDVAVFDDPALRPVRPYHAALIRRGGAHFVAAFVMVKPLTVMYPIPVSFGTKHCSRTLISTFSLFGSAPMKLA